MRVVDSSVQTDETELMIPSHSSHKNNQIKYKQPLLSTSLYSLKLLQAQKGNSLGMKKCILIFLCIIAFTVFGFIFFAYYCRGANSSCATPFPNYSLGYNTIVRPFGTSYDKNSLPTFEEVISKDFQFNIEGHDVMVFLHMQKTGGSSFGRHLVNDLDLKRECICHRRRKKKCTCLRPGPNSREIWLFSRFSTGWKCGLHADWTELTGCVDKEMDKIEGQFMKRRYFYVTYLRNPISRFLSEYRHVRRGATWKNSLLLCNGRLATKTEVPPCYTGDDWSDVSLNEFMSCESNLAINRQTRMLADLSLVNCYNKSGISSKERDTIMLASAKSNLLRMPYFGLTEFQEISQYIFEETFNLKFNVRFEQNNMTIASDVEDSIASNILSKIKELNHLDIELYNYAKDILHKRFEQLKKTDEHFVEHFEGMGKVKESWEEEIIDKN